MKAVQHMAGIGKTLAQADDPGRAVAVDVDLLHGIDVVALIQAGSHLVIEGFCVHVVSGDVQRADQFMPLGIVGVNAIGIGSDGHHDALAVVQMHMVLVREYVQHLRRLREAFDVCHDLLFA